MEIDASSIGWSPAQSCKALWHVSGPSCSARDRSLSTLRQRYQFPRGGQRVRGQRMPIGDGSSKPIAGASRLRSLEARRVSRRGRKATACGAEARQAGRKVQWERDEGQRAIRRRPCARGTSARVCRRIALRAPEHARSRSARSGDAARRSGADPAPPPALFAGTRIASLSASIRAGIVRHRSFRRSLHVDDAIALGGSRLCSSAGGRPARLRRL